MSFLLNLCCARTNLQLWNSSFSTAAPMRRAGWTSPEWWPRRSPICFVGVGKVLRMGTVHSCISEDFVKFGGKEEPSRVGEGFGLEVPFLLAGCGEAILSGPTVFEALHLLGFLFGGGRGRRAAHAVAVHHAGSHGLHVLLHPLHVAYQRFPHIHVVPPACHLVRILDRENVSLHLRERRLHLLHVGLHGLHLLLVHLHHLLTMLGPHLVSNAGAGRRLRELFLCPHHGRQSEYQNE